MRRGRDVWDLSPQLLDDAGGCLVAGHGAGGDLAAKLASLLVGDLVAGRAERRVSAGDRALDLNGGVRRRGLARPRGAGTGGGLQVGDVADEYSVPYGSSLPAGPGVLEGFRGLRASTGVLRNFRIRTITVCVSHTP